MIDPGIQTSLMSHGVLGVVCVLLLAAIVILWKQANAHVEARFAREREYQKDQAEQQERYRLALESTKQTLDSVVRMFKKGGD